jgi:hypothetical protein
VLLFAGVALSILRSFGIGAEPEVQYGIGIPCLVALVVCVLMWALARRRERTGRIPQHTPNAESGVE